MSDARTRVRVLMVEDSADDAELLLGALAAAGLDIEARVVAAEVSMRAELARFVPELVVTDWNLPGFSGVEAIAIARELIPDVPCILVSGTVGEELVVDALRTRATDYVLKHRLEALGPAVRRALAEGAAHREMERLGSELAMTNAALHGSLEAMADAFAICTSVRDPGGAITDFAVMFANQAAAALIGAAVGDVVGRSFRAGLPSVIRDQLFASCVDVVENQHRFEANQVDVSDLGAPRSTPMWIDITMEPFGDGFFVILRDVTARTILSRERDRLAAVVEDSADAIAIADPGGLLTYVNGAFQDLATLPRDEIIGQPMPVVAGRFMDAEGIAWIEGRVQQIETDRREFSIHVAEGPPRRVALGVSSQRGSDGAILSIVTSIHDITDLREAQAYADVQAGIRAQVVEVLRTIREETTLDQAAQTICDQLVTLPSIDLASVNVFLESDDLRAIGIRAPAGFPVGAGDRLPAERAAFIHERLQSGPWAWYAADDPTGGEWVRRMVEAGLEALAYGPISVGDELVGVLVIGTYSHEFAKMLVEKMPGLVSFSVASSGLLAARMQAVRRDLRLRRSIEAIIADRAFKPVFQPIVDLHSREIIGYEALTRFTSGQRPDLCFADAKSVGLLGSLEMATITEALSSAASLPSGLWLSLNVSPSLVCDPATLSAALHPVERPIVLEVTEHDPIADYAAVRDSVRAAGRSIRLAVDDAGVGVANFNHIIELRPDFVKLDISLVRCVSSDLGRQAMVVGLQHFARTTGCRLVAEGVETEPDATTLARIGVDFGQGYLFGRPAPVKDLQAGKGSSTDGDRRTGPKYERPAVRE